MRISAHRDDTGYQADCTNLEVYLDGKRVEACITADEERGYILKYVTEDGKLQLDETGEDVMIEELYGEVKIKKKYMVILTNDPSITAGDGRSCSSRRAGAEYLIQVASEPNPITRKPEYENLMTPPAD